MHPADISASLRKAGSSQAQIARQLRASKPAVCAIVHGRKRSARIEAAIAKATGLTPMALWPQRAAKVLRGSQRKAIKRLSRRAP